jgi:hypothetical protein
MHTNFAVAMMAGTVHQDLLVSGYFVQRQRARRLHVVRYDNVQVLTEIESVLQDLLSVMDEQLVNSLRSHPPCPPSEEGGKLPQLASLASPCPPF